MDSYAVVKQNGNGHIKWGGRMTELGDAADIWRAVLAWSSHALNPSHKHPYAPPPYRKLKPKIIDVKTGNPADIDNENAIEILKEAQHLIDDDQGLGIYSRLRVIWIASELSQSDLAKACGVPLNRLRENLQHGSSRFHAEVWEAAARYAADKIWKGPNALTVQEVKYTPFRGPSAVSDFYSWIRTGELPISSNISHLSKAGEMKFYMEGEDRQKLLQHIQRFLRADGLKNLLVVYHDSMWFGLTALASKLVSETIPAISGLPCCYLPLAQRALREQGKRLPNLIATLDAFYSGKPLQETSLPKSAREIKDAIHRVRTAMACRPAILVFDGCVDIGNRMTPLQRLIAGDPLIDLLNSLLHPLRDKSEAGDPNIFYRNRIILLSDGPHNEISPFRDGSAHLLPPPLPHETAQLLYGRMHDTAPRIEMLSGLALDDETLVTLTDSIIRATDKARVGLREHESLANPSQAMQLLSRVLSESEVQRIDLMMLRFCALSHSGLRQSTLERLLGQWSRIVTPASPWKIPDKPALIRTAIKEALARYPWILSEDLDELIPALDDNHDHRPLEYLDSPVAFAEADWGYPPVSLDIRSPSLRTTIINDMEGPLKDYQERVEMICAMHRLLAEESLRQQTIVGRHSDWEESHSLRFFRRAIQGLYHGFKSLGRSSLPEKYTDISRIQSIIPIDRRDAFRYLFGIFYRADIEAPPHWELSRVLGGDQIKCELLWVALSAATNLRQGEDEDSLQASLIVEEMQDLLRGNQDDALFTELISAFARSSYHAGRSRRVQLAASLGRLAAERKNSAKPGITLAYHQGSALRKVGIDDYILRGDNATAERFSRRYLEEAGFPSVCLTAIRTSIELVLDPRHRSGDVYSVYLSCILDAEKKITGAHDAVKLTEWSDLLCRYAETIFLQTHVKGDGDARPRLEAFLIFLMAEHLRKRAFTQEPLGRMHVISARATQAFISIALSLLQLRIDERVYFFQQARRHADILTRYLSRYPVARASLLVIEAEMARTAVAVGMVPEGLSTALTFLENADKQLAMLPGRNRARLRLLLERSKIFHAMVTSDERHQYKFSLAGDEQPFLDMAAYDAVLLRRLAAPYGQFWISLANAQIGEIRELCKKQSYVPKLLKEEWEQNLVHGGEL